MSNEKTLAERVGEICRLAPHTCPHDELDARRLDWVDTLLDRIDQLTAENEELMKQRDEVREVLHEEGYNICGPSCPVCRVDRGLE